MKRKSKIILAGLLLLSMFLQTMPVYAAETDTTGSWGTASWTFNEATGEVVISAGELTDYRNSPWNTGEIEEYKIFKIILDGDIIAPANSSYLFSDALGGLSNLKTIENESNLDTSNVTNMYGMFARASSLESLDLSSWDTSNVTNMHSMFCNTSSLESLDLSSWNTSNVTDMENMFLMASSLENLDVSNWDTSNLININSMFWEASSLKSLNLSSWDTSNVEHMGGMFCFASSLESVDLSNWDVSSVMTMDSMFEGSSSLKNLDLSNWNTSSVKLMGKMFFGTSSLENLDVSNWDVSSVMTMDMMFYEASSLESLDLSNWDTSNVIDMTNMFSGVNALKTIVLGENFKFFNNAGLPTGSNPYSDCWIGETIGTIYNTTAEFTEYDGINPDIYTRVLLEPKVVFEPNGGKFEDESTEATEDIEDNGSKENKDDKEDDNSKKNLPKAGIANSFSVIFGLSAIGVGAYLLKNKKKNNI